MSAILQQLTCDECTVGGGAAGAPRSPNSTSSAFDYYAGGPDGGDLSAHAQRADFPFTSRTEAPPGGPPASTTSTVASTCLGSPSSASLKESEPTLDTEGTTTGRSCPDRTEAEGDLSAEEGQREKKLGSGELHGARAGKEPNQTEGRQEEKGGRLPSVDETCGDSTFTSCPHGVKKEAKAIDVRRRGPTPFEERTVQAPDSSDKKATSENGKQRKDSSSLEASNCNSRAESQGHLSSPWYHRSSLSSSSSGGGVGGGFPPSSCLHSSPPHAPDRDINEGSRSMSMSREDYSRKAELASAGQNANHTAFASPTREQRSVHSHSHPERDARFRFRGPSFSSFPRYPAASDTCFATMVTVQRQLPFELRSLEAIFTVALRSLELLTKEYVERVRDTIAALGGKKSARLSACLSCTTCTAPQSKIRALCSRSC